jgi:hypothetical protein
MSLQCHVPSQGVAGWLPVALPELKSPLLLVILCLACLLWLKTKGQEHDMDGIPGPRGLPLLGSSLELSRKNVS